MLRFIFCPLLCSFLLHRAQVHPLGLQFLFCAFPTFVLTGSCAATLCWSQRPMRPSRCWIQRPVGRVEGAGPRLEVGVAMQFHL